jgi:plastocyanin
VTAPGRLRRAAGPALLAALLLAAAGCGGPVPRVHQVSMHGFQFDPATLTAAPGDTVVFTNADVTSHTATAAGGAWDSGPIAPGAAWKLVVADGSAGAFKCTFHPTMTGTLAAARWSRAAGNSGLTRRRGERGELQRETGRIDE